MAQVMDVYEAHRAYRTALYTQKGDALTDWETRNPDIMNLLAHVRWLKAEIEKRGNE